MRTRYFTLCFWVVAAALLLAFPLPAQGPSTEAEVKTKADKLFEAEDYPAAMPLYSQLLANHPSDPNFSYRYGVCVLYGSADKDKALPFLEKAAKSPGVEADVWFFLGRAYHLNYQFEQAIGAYNKFKSLGGAKKTEKLQVDNQIAMCKTGRKLLKAITDITVLDKAELNEADFFRRYDLNGAGYSGQLLVKPDEFKTSIDKKKNEQSIIFLSGEKNELYFSSYGADETQGKDIYVVRKLPNGTWGKPQNVGYPINTEYDEDYPFLHPNGKALYFSSKGHNSMGGYDIFRAELNEETSTWQKPVNLDFAINSPDDDILFVSDFNEETAWFASSRSSPEGRMTVYHVVIERKPVSMCLIAGAYTPTSGDKNRKATITVKNAETNSPVGVYKSNEATGAYFMSLPNNGGRYTFTVEHSGIHTQTETVFIPPQYEIKTLNQRIGYNDVAGESQLFVMTDFDTDTSMLDPTFLKDKAKLDINPMEMTQVVDLDNPGQKGSTIPEAGGNDTGSGTPVEDDTTESVDPSEGVPSSGSGVTNQELVKTAMADADQTQSEATDMKEAADRAFQHLASLNKDAIAQTAKAADAKAAAAALPEGPEKTAAQAKANEEEAKANSLQTQVVAANEVTKALETDANLKQQEADKAKQYAQQLDKALNGKDPKALDQAAALEKDLAAMSDSRPQGQETAKNLGAEADKAHAALETAKTSAQDLREENAQNEERIRQLRAEQAKEKDPDLRQGIDQQIEGINEDIADNNKEIKKADAEVARLQSIANDLDNQVAAANAILAQSKSSSIPIPLSPEEKKEIDANATAYQQSIAETGSTRVFAPVAGGTQTSGGTNPVTGGTQTSGGTDPVTGGTQTSGGTDPVTGGTQTSGGTDPVTGGTDPLVNDSSDSDPVAENLDAPFLDALQQADTIKDPVARENAKAQAYTDWGANIDKQVQEKKKQLAATKDKDEKAKISEEIKQLQAASTEKKQDAKASTAAARQAQKDKDAQPVASMGEQFTDKISAAGQLPTVAEQETAKEQVYTDWADSLDAQAAAKEEQLLKTKNKKEQEKLKDEVMALRSEADEKRNLADEAKTKAEAATTVAAGGTQPSTTGTTDVNEVKYDAPAAGTALDDKQRLDDQAQAYREKQDSLTTLAASASGPEKTKLLGQATEQQRLAWQKDEEASAKQGDASKAQFDANAQRLAPYNAAALTSSDPGAATASLLADEAQALFDQARKAREEAANAPDKFTRDNLLHDAEEKEEKALQKQQQALARYEQSGLQPVAGTNPVTGGTQTSGGADPVTGGTQTSGGADPVTGGTQTSGGADPVTGGTQTSGGADPVTGGTQTSGGADPVTGGTQTSGGSDPVTGGTQTSGGTDPVTGGTQTSGGTDPVTGGTQTSGGTDPVTGGTQTSGGADPVTGGTQTSGGADPVTGGTQTSGGADPVTGGTQTSGGADPVTGGTQTSGGADPVTGGTQTSGGSDPVTGGTQTSGGADPVTGGTQTSGGSDPVTGGTQTSGGADPVTGGTQTSGSTQRAMNPATGEPFTPEQVEAIRGTDTYRNYIEAHREAVEAEQRVATLEAQAGDYQRSANTNIEKAQDFAVKAADEQDPAKKQQFIEESKRYNEIAKTEMARRDSVNELADFERPEATAKRTEAEVFLNGIDKATYEEVKAVADADYPKTGSTARTGDPVTGGTNPVTGGTNPVTGGTDPVTGGTNPVTGGTNPVTGGTNPVTGGTNPVTGGTNPVTGGTNPVTGGTNPVTGGTNPVTGGTNPVTGGTNPVTGGTNPVTGGTNTGSVTNRLAPGEQFTTTAQPAAQIPVNPPLPEGLVYKVQIGAFRNPISPEIYKGIQPVTAETAGNGLTRYTAGYFTQFINADAAKNEIRAMGYPDAFVVAFCNGRRMSVAEARRTCGESGSSQNPPLAGGTQGGTNPPATGGTQGGTNPPSTGGTNPATGGTPPSAGTSSRSVAPATDVKSVTGLFYTVQVGVFSREVSAAQLYNLSGLFSERTPNGFIRYSAGKYNNLGSAIDAKTGIIGRGGEDAFVTAYYNGERISIEKAKELEAQGKASGTTNVDPLSGSSTTSSGGSTQPETSGGSTTTSGGSTQPETSGGSTQPETSGGSTTTSGGSTQPETSGGSTTTTGGTQPETSGGSAVTSALPVPATGLVFSVQIGAFRDEVPLDIANKFIQLTSYGVKNYVDASSGLTVYQVGVLASKEEAESLRNIAIEKGITDAFIVAWKDGKKISVEEALGE